MDISNLCRREVVTIDARASLHQAATLMCEEHVGALVVTTGQEPPQATGIVTDRDLAIDVLGHSEISELEVGQLAKGPPVAVSGTCGLREAAAAMEQAGVRRLLVIDNDGGVIGLVSADDLIAAMAEDLAALSRALRSGIAREKSERKVAVTPPRARAVFPAFGVASQ